jgi:hypothetical protein
VFNGLTIVTIHGPAPFPRSRPSGGIPHRANERSAPPEGNHDAKRLAALAVDFARIVAADARPFDGPSCRYWIAVVNADWNRASI